MGSFLVFKRKRTSREWWETLDNSVFQVLCNYLATEDEKGKSFVPVITTIGTPECVSGLTVMPPRDETKQWMSNVLQSRSIRPNCPKELLEATTVSMLWKEYVLVENDAVLLGLLKGLAGICTFKFMP